MLTQIQTTLGSYQAAEALESSSKATPDQGAAMSEIAALERPSFAMDVNAQALAALSTMLRELQKSQRTLERANEQAQQASREKAVEAMREEADAMRTGAVVAGTMQAASAFEHFNAAGRTDEVQQRLHTGLAGVLDSGSSTAKQIGDAAAVDHKADGAAANNEAEQSRARAEELRDLSQETAELARKANEAVRALMELEHSTHMAIIGRV